jgi:stage II sporulation protein R
MKKIIAVAFIAGFTAVLLIGFLTIAPQQEPPQTDFLRIHIRANSNSAADQDVKYKIKEQIVNVLTPVLVNITNKEDAVAAVGRSIPLIESAANEVLGNDGFGYGSKAEIRCENFPDRVYDGVTVPQGVYDALILNLGAGAGDNWWCVVYPPLCFTDSTIGGDKGVIYRSKIAEIIKKWSKK